MSHEKKKTMREILKFVFWVFLKVWEQGTGLSKRESIFIEDSTFVLLLCE